MSATWAAVVGSVAVVLLVHSTDSTLYSSSPNAHSTPSPPTSTTLSASPGQSALGTLQPRPTVTPSAIIPMTVATTISAEWRAHATTGPEHQTSPQLVRLLADGHPHPSSSSIVVPTTHAAEMVLTSHAAAEDAPPALEAGAVGYLLEHSGPDAVLRAIRQAHRRETVLHLAIARRVAQKLQQPRRPRQLLFVQPAPQERSLSRR